MHYSKNKKVLNTFAYSGGFSLYALQAGASIVHAVDSSKKAMEWANQNVELNFKNVRFNETLDYPFSIPKNYKRN